MSYSSETISKALALYAKGLPGHVVETITGMKDASVRYHARKKGIVRPKIEHALTQKQKEEIRYLYVSLRHSRRQVADIMGINYGKVYRYLVEENLIRDRKTATRICHTKKQRVKTWQQKRIEKQLAAQQ